MVEDNIEIAAVLLVPVSSTDSMFVSTTTPPQEDSPGAIVRFPA
jgi:hypothetical protein